jgi:hypothetical protein
VAALLALVDEAFDRKAWHGTNLRGLGARARREAGVVRTPRRPSQHLGADRPRGVLEVRGAAAGSPARRARSFAEKGSNFFARPAAGKSWDADEALLVHEHALLREGSHGCATPTSAGAVGRWTRAGHAARASPRTTSTTAGRSRR